MRVSPAVRPGLWLLTGSLFLVVASGFEKPVPLLSPAKLVQQLFLTDVARLDSVAARLETAVRTHQPQPVLQAAFGQTRNAYKRVEYLTEYYYPLLAQSVNGPPVPESEMDDGVGLQQDPNGLQVMEAMLFSYNPATHADLLEQATRLRTTLADLHRVARVNPVADGHVFDAMRLEVFRIIALGISGFDTPITHRALPEAAVALASLRQPLSLYLPQLRAADPALANRLEQTVTEAISTVRRSKSFDRFDRLHFIRNHAYTLSRLLLDAQRALHIPLSTDRTRLLSASAATLSEPTAFDPGFFTNTEYSRPTPARVELGRQLFYDPMLSGNGQRTCATCHRPDRAFTDGEPTSFALNGHGRIGRNTPTLLNAALQTAQFMDSRVFGLEDQIREVIQSETEMGGSLTRTVEQLKQQAAYQTCFTEAYADGLTEYTIVNALASYIRSLTALDSRVDRYLRGQPVLLTVDEKQGFNLFMGKANCGTCHYFPLFNGSVPPGYQKTESEVIGVPATLDEHRVDADSGRYRTTKLAIHRGAFKIPTVRHSARTAPYMHNGVYPTLEQVVEFYNKGGGNGLGFKLPNQTLPPDKLNLTPGEKRALVAFMKAL